MVLPCTHLKTITDQVEPTVRLLVNLDELHPEVLLQHSINPQDYHRNLVFRSAVESIRGQYIASSTTGREGLVSSLLEILQSKKLIEDFAKRSSRNRHDFEIVITKNPDYFSAIEVKGGEGNSINISDRPLWAKEFAVWCHLDGAIVNQPAHGAHAIINRLTNEMMLRGKQVDLLIFKDVLCGTTSRPCPKYPGSETEVGMNASPDLFLFPQRIPRPEEPTPPVHTLNTLRLPGLLLELFGVKQSEFASHIWEVHVTLVKREKNGNQHRFRILHQGSMVGEGSSRIRRSQ